MPKSAEQLFCERRGGRNFFTPSAISFHFIEHGVCELSEGIGPAQRDCKTGRIVNYRPKWYGVTVAGDDRNEELDEKRSRMFYTEAEAILYINSMKKKAKVA